MSFQIPTLRESNAKLYDQFFTKEEHAIDCVKFFVGATTHDINKFDCVVEPSFGKGAFLKAMVNHVNFDPSKLLFVDIDAEDQCYRHNFLTFNHDKIGSPNLHSYLTIGNPPFGKNASLAVAFFNKAAEYSSVIAFIVPRTFFKTSLINKLDKRFVLEAYVALPEDVFTFEGKSYSVPCVFQIWARGTPREHIKEVKETDDFAFVDRFHGDFAIRRVGVNAGRVLNWQACRSLSSQSHLFVRAKNRSNPRKVYDTCVTLELHRAKEKYNTAGCPSLSKGEICKLYLLK